MTALLRKHPDALIPASVFALGLATIAGAWAFQIVGHYVPCQLCLEQRIPYYVGLPVALAAFAAAATGLPTRIVSLLMALTAVIFAVGLYLGVYHSGVEWQWWAGPPDCGGTGAGVTSAEDLLNQLQGIRIVSCTEARWRFPAVPWGLSFAGWNAAISATLVAASSYAALRGLRPAERATAE